VEESVNVHYVKCHVRVLEELAYHFLGPKFLRGKGGRQVSLAAGGARLLFQSFTNTLN
jgi:hypothetical protein